MAALKLLSVFCILFGTATSVSVTCPYLEDLNPCDCKRIATGSLVTCSNFDSADTLERVLRIMSDYKVHTLLLHNLHIKEMLPSNLFKGLNIKKIQIGESELRFNEPVFAGLDSTLNILVEKESMVKSNQTFKIAKLSKLSSLDVQNNNINEVDDTWLQDKVPNIREVVLDYNDIKVIQDRAFASMPYLTTISLADNRIKKVKRSMFSDPALHLNKIDLSFNELKSLPHDFFQKMPSLKMVILSGNPLRSLPEPTWSVVWEQLTQVLLIDTQIECDEELNWIKDLRKPANLKGVCYSPMDVNGNSIAEVYS